jgi:hypothetical protein
VEQLRVAAGDGRLTADELDHRLETALTARTYGELAALTADLPGISDQRPAAGVIDIEDTHRDAIASELPQGAGYQPEGFAAGVARHVDFLGSYPPGDLHEGALWGPMREETTTWIHRLLTGASTQHATAAEAHRNLMLTMAMDLSARTGEAVKLPVDAARLRAPAPT